ncbi:MAG: putative RNA methyltransferase [Candidatus Heteroscillospira sp.]|jgi:23S rRNA (guanine745-N1)-methyltransferase
MLRFNCPVCSLPLWDMPGSLRCAGGHCFDRSKKGYVNLALSAASGKKRHGDDRLMVSARRDFLEKGYYEPLRREICRLAASVPGERLGLLDAGCGEGWYTSGVKAHLEAQGRTVDALGVDISRDALIEAHRRDASLSLAVAGANRLPVPDGEVDVLLSVFAPVFPEEFARVLAPRGVVIRAVPLREHLFGLKSAVYDTPYHNPDMSPELVPLRLLEQSQVRYNLTLDNNADIQALFRMTPYFYKTGRDDQAKLEKLEHLETELHFGVWVYGL